jgi:hypothetical protein
VSPRLLYLMSTRRASMNDRDWIDSRLASEHLPGRRDLPVA